MKIHALPLTHLLAPRTLCLVLLLSVPATRSGASDLLDPSFGSNGLWFHGIDAGGTNFETIQAIAIQPDGKIVVAGWASVAGGGEQGYIGRLLESGSYDPSFGSNGWVLNPFGIGSAGKTRFEAVALQPDGKIVVAGTYTIISSDSDFIVGRLAPAGDPDPTFGGSLNGYTTVSFDLLPGLRDEAHALALQSDGKIVVAGSANAGGSDNEFAAARLLANGLPDTSFSGDGKAVYSLDFSGDYADVARAIAIAADGKILLAGQAFTTSTGANFALVRVLPNGDLDATFGSFGRCQYAIDLGGNKHDRARAVAIAPDGGYLLAGEADLSPGQWVWAVMKVVTQQSCNRDPSFNQLTGLRYGTFTCGGVSCLDHRDSARAMAVGSDGRIVIAGEGWGHHGPFDPANQDFGVARLLPNGLLDPTFGNGGVTVVDFDQGPGDHDDGAYAVAIAPDGGILVAGLAEWSSLNVDLAVARLTVQVIFADGFESGTTGAWTGAVP